ncbi:MAG: hypothetical protein ACMX3H_18515 [Sodalis sp. (in: enterobacteria)]|uniref:hypothetical protein n=1 Tax=Sodalis sp. (in: enterobacteria) TaxID=1898979 RepID=UPI0039E408EB
MRRYTVIKQHKKPAVKIFMPVDFFAWQIINVVAILRACGNPLRAAMIIPRFASHQADYALARVRTFYSVKKGSVIKYSKFFGNSLEGVLPIVRSGQRKAIP